MSTITLRGAVEVENPLELALEFLAAYSGEADSSAITLLFDAFADIRGVGFAKMTKALYRKRPALIPILDSVVQTYLKTGDPGTRPSGSSESALSSSWGATNETWIATGRLSTRSSESSRAARTGSPRCESSIS
jgi:Family of unknown function (DUF6308)